MFLFKFPFDKFYNKYVITINNELLIVCLFQQLTIELNNVLYTVSTNAGYFNHEFYM